MGDRQIIFSIILFIQEKASLLEKLNRTEDSDNIIEELKNQLRIEADRKHRVRFELFFYQSQM